MTMPTIPDIWSLWDAPITEVLGWTLLHFVWQGALLAALLAGALSLLRTSPPRIRYAVSCIALFGLLVMPLGTGVFLATSVPGPSPAPADAFPVEAVSEFAVPHSAPGAAEAPGSVVSFSPPWVSTWIRPALPWIVFAWGLGVLVFTVRFAGGAWRVRRLRRRSTNVRSTWWHRLRTLAERMGVRHRVELGQSAQLETPLVAGWWRPVILVPTGLLSGLPPDQVEALLLHELAHIRRHDVLVGRLQAILEALLFFHPGTWWISQQIRRTREACCDTLAIEAGTERTVYARSLAALAERVAGQRSPTWAPAANSGSLLTRIQRVLSSNTASSHSVHDLSLTVAVLLLLGVPAGLAACVSQQAAPDVKTNETAMADAETPVPPDTSTAGAEPKKAVVTRGDSTERSVDIEFDDPVHIDRLEEGGFVIRHEGEVDTIGPFRSSVEPLGDGTFIVRSNGRVDTVEYSPPEIEPLEGGGFVMRHDGTVDTLARSMPAVEHLEDGTIVLRQNARVDTLTPPPVPDAPGLQGLPFNPDSLERALHVQINPDSVIERVLRMQLNPDSLEQRLRRVHERADSLQSRDWPDPDSLARWHRRHSDSLRRSLDSLREQMERRFPEQLRDQARRLREQAKRLEEQADEMEEPTTPSPSTPPGPGQR